MNGQGQLQCQQDPKDVTRVGSVKELPLCREKPIFHEPVGALIKDKEQLTAMYPNSFDRIGSLKGEYTFKIDPSVAPVQQARRKVPIESKEAISVALDSMIADDILEPQIEPTPWVNKKDVTFYWDDQLTQSFQEIKHLLKKQRSKPLGYYDRRKEVIVQADASLRGLGACLIQDGKPIAFASKSLTGAESHYANIERELLAVVFACIRFNTYLQGRRFTVQSDHKPLEMIHLKSMHNAPPRLQRMLLQLQKYDMKIEYKPGSEMLLADALLRCPARYSQEIKLDLRVHYIAFTSAWIETLRETTCKDLVLSTVYQLVQHGWPKKRRRVPNVAKYYTDFRDELSTDEGLLLKGPSLIIPATLRENYLQRLHEGHLSANKTITNARQHMFWPGIEADIKDYTRRCQVCIKGSRPAREPLQPHEIPGRAMAEAGHGFLRPQRQVAHSYL